MKYLLENDTLKVTVKKAGAELISVLNKTTGLEYMWQADPAYWGKTSPVLFPIVGTLVNDTYTFKEKSYRIGRHGFARDNEFEFVKQNDQHLQLSLAGSDNSFQNYPFKFILYISYTLKDNSLEVLYQVENKDDKEMLFSLGAHPAFKVPLVEGTKYSDYYMEFNQSETVPRWPINKDGLIEKEPVPFFKKDKKVALSYDLFYNEALVFKQLQSNRISIKSSKHEHGLDFRFDNFPFMGIWAAKNANFLCIEPWCGIADSEDHDQQLAHKEGIEKLSPGDKWHRSWSIDLY